MNYTRGEWSVQGQLVVSDGAAPICIVCPTGNLSGDEDRQKADAHLISASPDMYEALEAIKKELKRHEGDSLYTAYLNIKQITIILKALSKARGEDNE